MPHLRNRLVLPKLLKLLKFFPVVAIQGARQTGKSFLAREILSKESKNPPTLRLMTLIHVEKHRKVREHF